MERIPGKRSWNKVAIKDTWLTRILYCVFKTAMYLYFVPRKRVTQISVETIYTNTRHKTIGNIFDLNRCTQYSHGQNTVITSCRKNALEFRRTTRLEHRGHERLYYGRRRNALMRFRT